MRLSLGLIIVLLVSFACKKERELLFIQVENSGVDFSNDLNYSQELNPYTYRNYYNGAGVGIGDFNNDGLEDLYFTGNQVGNRLYKNLGHLRFEEVEAPLLSCFNSWSTGVSIVDINSDGLLDIYVCKSGPPGGERRFNELFINKGDFKFEEKAHEFGLDITGFSVQASFFDFDKDGDLDCYLLNNSIRSVGGYDLREGLRDIATESGNMLLVNEDGHFFNRSSEFGIYTSDIGFGLGVNTSDINSDGWKDIYVGNDFFEKDYLYINRNGKFFEESGEEYMSSFSMGSMGVDVADLNQDGKNDVLVAEMAPSTLERKKTKATYESWEKYNRSLRNGYYHQYARNMLHLNQGGYFSDVSRTKGIEATEWSWAPLIFDMDNDGLNDIYISNGVGKDLLDRDYLAYMADEYRVQELLKNRNSESLKKLIDIMPSQKVINAFYLQKGELNFEDISNTLVDQGPTFSNATALSDLDNDGDLDMVISNINDISTILENQSVNNFLKIKLNGNERFPNVIGTELKVYMDGDAIHAECNPFRGFQSTLTQAIIIGLGQRTKVDSIKIYWPEGLAQTLYGIEVNSTIDITKSQSLESFELQNRRSNLSIKGIDTLQYQYAPRVFNEFNKEKMLTSMLPSLGPLLFNVGEREIIYGGGQNLYPKRQDFKNGNIDSSFNKSYRPAVSDVHSFDFDNDGDLDLYFSHGSRVFSPYSPHLNDCFYENKGNGDYAYQKNAVSFEKPIYTSCATSIDLNGDGFLDLIVGEQIRDDIYGKNTRLFYLENNEGKGFRSARVLDIDKMGMIFDLETGDVDNDGEVELLVSGEWMGIRVFDINSTNASLTESEMSLREMVGMWRDIKLADIDNDGDLDIIAANQGSNSYLKPSMKLFVNDFDGNGRAEQIFTSKVNGEYYPIHDYDEISSQLPQIRNLFKGYSDYSKATIHDLFDENIIQKAIVFQISELRSGVFINEKGALNFNEFPEEVQYSSMHEVEVGDVNEDGITDILIGGNHYLYKPQFGRDDASRGFVLIGREDGSYQTESLNIEGEIRLIKNEDNNQYWIGVNEKDIIKYEINFIDAD